MYEIRRYTPAQAGEWNDFVACSRNGTFLLDRRYMDYHADRMNDHSLLVYRDARLFALLPGNGRESVFHSHQGLTYGGLITDERATAGRVCDIFDALNDYLRRDGFSRVVYKPVPWIYHRLPAEEDLYALFVRCGARLTVRDASSAVVLRRPLALPESRRSGVRKARRAGVTIRESGDWEAFWTILSENLRGKYGATPIHSLAEIRLLSGRFPENIRLVMAYRGEVPVGGTVIYLSSQVVHTQYISASPEGKQTGALDLLFLHLLQETDFRQPYFDFGTSALGDTCELNRSLIFQKEGLGGRCVCYDAYEYDL